MSWFSHQRRNNKISFRSRPCNDRRSILLRNLALSTSAKQRCQQTQMADKGQGIKAAARMSSTTEQPTNHPRFPHTRLRTASNTQTVKVNSKTSSRNKSTQQLMTYFTIQQPQNITSTSARNQTTSVNSYKFSPGTSVKQYQPGHNDTKSHACNLQDRIKGQGRVPPLLLVHLESCSYRRTFIICLLYIYIV
jgi:hypothetical protein